MKRSIVVSIIALFTCTFSYGQGETDAFRYSRNDLTGTARGIAMGGAFGALGADVAGLSANPAGLGVYRSSEVLATMNFSSANIKAEKDGIAQSDSRFKFNFDNVAYVGYFPLGNETVSSINFAFSYNRLKNFDRDYSSGGRNMPTSLTDFMAQSSFGLPETMLETYPGHDPYTTGAPWMSVLAYNGYLISPDSDPNHPNQYLSPLNQGDRVDPQLRVSERGAIESYDFSLGTNFSEKLYIGLTFALTDLHYSMSSKYSEEFVGTTNGFDLYNDLLEDGSGYQVSIGAIYRPIDALRIGVAYHSPTWYGMTRSAQGETNYEHMEDGKLIYSEALTPDLALATFDYKLQTPYRWTFSAAAILGTKAVVSIDYELTDYSGMDMQDINGYEYTEDNGYVNEDFKKASTVKIGGEYKITPQISLRAGYAWMQNPYSKDINDGNQGVVVAGTVPHYVIEGDVHHITCGLGYRITKNFYLDAAFVYRMQTDELYYFPKYFDEVSSNLLVDSTPAKFTNNTYKGLLTLGYKF